MAAPHAAGLAALLLSAEPALGTKEVRWHLELNADQPGHPGYEGAPWNPYLGWGRIDAARVFDPVPVTTRIVSDTNVLHGLAGTGVADVCDASLSFTTHDPVAWSLPAATAVGASPTSGSGPAALGIGLELAGVGEGTHEAALVVDAPGAADGGAALPLTVHAHRDQRVGAPIVVDPADYPQGTSSQAALASDGSGVLAAWVEHANGPQEILVAYVADDGTVSGPFAVWSTAACPFPCTDRTPEQITVVHDGGAFLLVWVEYEKEMTNVTKLRFRRHTRLHAMRVTANGQVLDAVPATLRSESEDDRSDGGFDRWVDQMTAGFDGSQAAVVWRVLDFGSDTLPVEVFLARVGTDGALAGSATSIYPIPGQPYGQIRPRVACVTGSCLVAWIQGKGERNAFGRFLFDAVGRRYVGYAALDAAPYRLSHDMLSLTAIATSPDGYLLAGDRLNQPAADVLGDEIVVARVAADGTPLDPDPIRASNGVSPGTPYIIRPSAAVFDGRSYLVTWEQIGPRASENLWYQLAARISPSGALEDAEPEGLLLAPKAVVGFGAPALAVTATRSLVVWREAGTWQAPGRLLAQAVFERTP
jgi:hypothetical protein